MSWASEKFLFIRRITVGIYRSLQEIDLKGLIDYSGYPGNLRPLRYKGGGAGIGTIRIKNSV